MPVDDEKTPRSAREERYLERLLEALQIQNAQQSATLELIRAEMTEMRQVVAKETDCAGRAERERLDRHDGFKRVHEKIDDRVEKVADALRDVRARVDRNSAAIDELVGERREATGAHKAIKSKEDEAKEQRKARREVFWRYAIPVLIVATTSVATWIVTRIFN